MSKVSWIMAFLLTCLLTGAFLEWRRTPTSPDYKVVLVCGEHKIAVTNGFLDPKADDPDHVWIKLDGLLEIPCVDGRFKLRDALLEQDHEP